MQHMELSIYSNFLSHIMVIMQLQLFVKQGYSRNRLISVILIRFIYITFMLH